MSCEGGGSENNSQHRSGIFFHRHALSASAYHLRRAIEELLRIQSHHSGGHHAEIRKRRVASPDRRTAIENGAEAIGLGPLLHLRSGIGNGDEAAARLIGAHSLFGSLEEVLLEDVGFESAAGFARHQEQRPCDIDARLEVPDLRRVGRVEHMQLWVAGVGTESLGKYLGPEARATHAEQ